MAPTLDIGFLSTHGNSENQSLFFKGVLDAAKAYDARIIRFDAQVASEAFEQENAGLQHLLEVIEDQRLDGLMFLGWMPGIAGPRQESFLKRFSHLPLYCLGAQHDTLAHAYADPSPAIAKLMHHLIEDHGHERIVFVPPGLFDLRQASYEKEMRKHDLRFDDLILPASLLAKVPYTERMPFAARYLLDEKSEPIDSILVMFDADAEALVQELKKRDIRVPEDIAVISFEDTEFARYSLPPRTSITFPWYDVAYQGSMQFLSQLHRQDFVSSLAVDSKLILRASCGCSMQEASLPPSQQAVAIPSPIHLAQKLPLIATSLARLYPTLLLDYPQLTTALYEDLQSEHPDRLYAFFSFWLDQQVVTTPSLDQIEQAEAMLHQMRRQILPLVSHDRKLVMRLQDILLQLMNAIEEKTVFVIGYSNAQIKTINQELHYVSQDLIVTYSLDKMLYILERDLKKLQIPSCYILYRTDDTTTGYSQIFHYTDFNRQEKSIRNAHPRQIIHSLLQEHTRLICQPLVSGDDYYGIILYEPQPYDLRIYQALSLHIGSAIKNALLLQRLSQEIRLRREKEQQLMHNADHDVLSGLLNRRSFGRVMQALIAAQQKDRADRKGFFLAFIDFDDFKKINDSYGHDVGDMLIIEIADRLRDRLSRHRLTLPDHMALGAGDREVIPVFRIGGDEFTAIFTGLSQQKLEDAASQLIETIRLPFKLAGHTIRVSCSIGISHCPDHGEDAERLLKRADTAMYDAKEQKNTFRLYDPARIRETKPTTRSAQ